MSVKQLVCAMVECKSQTRLHASLAASFGKAVRAQGGRRKRSTHEFVRDDGAVTESTLRPAPKVSVGDICMWLERKPCDGSGAAPLTVTSSALSSPLLNLASS